MLATLELHYEGIRICYRRLQEIDVEIDVHMRKLDEGTDSM